jgi:hypothetical protein
MENNPGKFVAEVRRELVRLRAELCRSLRNPHPEGAGLAEQGFAEWTGGLPVEDAGALVDRGAGKPVRWVPGKGWVAGRHFLGLSGRH